MGIYNVIVKADDEYFVAYTDDDRDAAEGHAEFCRATMQGAKITVELVEPMEREDR